MAEFVIVDALGATITDGFPPYSRSFITRFAPGGIRPPVPPSPAYLIVAAKTGYSVNAMSATVQINGRTIGVIDPRPWVNHNFFALEAIILPFSTRILIFNGSNRLAIVRQPGPPDPNNFVQVGSVVCHFQ